MDNTGGGGGGGQATDGGSGVVIVAYVTADAAGWSVTGGDRVVTDATMTYHVFTTVGSDASFDVS